MHTMNKESYEVLERAHTPRGILQLAQRGEHFEIISNGVFLMATYNGKSERLLVRLALLRHSNPHCVLIGGLGIGFSLAEALLHPDIRKVTVVEIESAIIDWNRRYFPKWNHDVLADSRVNLVQDDLVPWLHAQSAPFDVICLDIDNGPDWTVKNTNEILYQDPGLHTLARLLTPMEGVISFWSAAANLEFEQRLHQHFCSVEKILIPVNRGEPDVVYLARSADPP